MKSTATGPMALRVLTEKALALAMAVAVAVTQLHGGGAQTPASVQYVASPAGNFFVVPGKSILPWDAFALLGNTDSCKDGVVRMPQTHFHKYELIDE